MEIGTSNTVNQLQRQRNAIRQQLTHSMEMYSLRRNLLERRFQQCLQSRRKSELCTKTVAIQQIGESACNECWQWLKTVKSSAETNNKSDFNKEMLDWLSQSCNCILSKLRPSLIKLYAELQETRRKEFAYQETLNRADTIVLQLENSYKQRIGTLESRLVQMEDERQEKPRVHSVCIQTEQNWERDFERELQAADQRETELMRRLTQTQTVEQQLRNRCGQLEQERTSLNADLQELEQLQECAERMRRELHLAKRMADHWQNTAVHLQQQPSTSEWSDESSDNFQSAQSSIVTCSSRSFKPPRPLCWPNENARLARTIGNELLQHQKSLKWSEQLESAQVLSIQVNNGCDTSLNTATVKASQNGHRIYIRTCDQLELPSFQVSHSV